MLDLMVDKTHDENRQGEGICPIKSAAIYHNKSFYIESWRVLGNSLIRRLPPDPAIRGMHAWAEKADPDPREYLLDTRKGGTKTAGTGCRFSARSKQRPGLLIGVLGCMAERLETNLLEEAKLVDMVVGPDASPQPPFPDRRSQWQVRKPSMCC